MTLLFKKKKESQIKSASKKVKFVKVKKYEVDLPTGENLLLLKMGFGEVKSTLKVVMIMIFNNCNIYAH